MTAENVKNNTHTNRFFQAKEYTLFSSQQGLHKGSAAQTESGTNYTLTFTYIHAHSEMWVAIAEEVGWL